ncbi:hypothetical protein [Enterococcus rivorum]|uniref:hypothetical protein n=2 Tax=Enterococcus rivorum TaxID=762845 RepID=UPI00147238FF|nr:hypothetical protein [Enterococcus rivorum]MBP2098774.1 hypothetical protein [Enterococcus rivorum]
MMHSIKWPKDTLYCASPALQAVVVILNIIKILSNQFSKKVLSKETAVLSGVGAQ